MAGFISPTVWADTALTDSTLDGVQWLDRAAASARRITGRGAELTEALSEKGQLMAALSGFQAASGDVAGAQKYFGLAELCERALAHRNAQGPVSAALTQALAQAGRGDDAAARIAEMPEGLDRTAAEARLAAALVMANPNDPAVQARLKAGVVAARSSAQALSAWVPALMEAGQFDELRELLETTDASDAIRAAHLAGLAEAQARAGERRGAQADLVSALTLLGRDTTEASVLAVAGAHAALGQPAVVKHRVSGLQSPAAQIKGMAMLAAARGVAGSSFEEALAPLEKAAALATEHAGKPGVGQAVRQLTRVAADLGAAQATGQWVDRLEDPRLQAPAALGLAEGLMAPEQRSQMTRALPVTKQAEVVAADSKVLTEDSTETAGAVVVPDVVDSEATLTDSTDPLVVADPWVAGEKMPVLETTDAAAPALNQDVDGVADLSQTADRAVDDAMTGLPGAATTGSAASRLSSGESARAVLPAAVVAPWPGLPMAEPVVVATPQALEVPVGSQDAISSVTSTPQKDSQAVSHEDAAASSLESNLEPETSSVSPAVETQADAIAPVPASDPQAIRPVVETPEAPAIQETPVSEDVQQDVQQNVQSVQQEALAQTSQSETPDMSDMNSQAKDWGTGSTKDLASTATVPATDAASTATTQASALRQAGDETLELPLADSAANATSMNADPDALDLGSDAASVDLTPVESDLTSAHSAAIDEAPQNPLSVNPLANKTPSESLATSSEASTDVSTTTDALSDALTSGEDHVVGLKTAGVATAAATAAVAIDRLPDSSVVEPALVVEAPVVETPVVETPPAAASNSADSLDSAVSLNPADAVVSDASVTPDPAATLDVARVESDAKPSSEMAAGQHAVAVPDLRRLADPGDALFRGQSPAQYDARFTTTRGVFTLRVHRDWAPLAADRFYHLARSGFYNNNRFFRAVPGFVVQWGIHGFPNVATAWRNASIADEPVRHSNLRGTVAFAAAAEPNTRTTQVFVNLADNVFLDDLGFAPFAKIIQGLDVAEDLFSGYGEAPSQLQRRIQLDGNAFLDKNYPNLDAVMGVEISDTFK